MSGLQSSVFNVRARMTMNRHELTMRRALLEQWGILQHGLKELRYAAEIIPSDGQSVILHQNTSISEPIRFSLEPSVFKLPERGHSGVLDIYVVIKGLMEFDRARWSNENKLQTVKFSTRAAYFRHKKGNLEHIYGAHYDFSTDQVGHPAFHAQMNSFQELHEYVNSRFGTSAPVRDYMSNVLRTVRVPSAQMDFFSLFLQLIADHLLHEESNELELEVFNNLIKRGMNLQGAGSLVPSLSRPGASECYRSTHWYLI